MERLCEALRVISSIPGLYSLDASSKHPPTPTPHQSPGAVTTQNVFRCCEMSSRGAISPQILRTVGLDSGLDNEIPWAYTTLKCLISQISLPYSYIPHLNTYLCKEYQLSTSRLLVSISSLKIQKQELFFST